MSQDRSMHALAALALAAAVSCTAPAAAQPQLRSASGGEVRAFIVGIDQYQNVRPLLGSVNDAEDLKASLTAAGVTSIRVLENAEATRPAFVAEMERLLAASHSGDLAIMSYSGHGASVPEYSQFKGLEDGGKTEEYIMVDYAQSGPATAEVIANKELKAWLSRFDAKGVDVLVVSDSCFGGGMIRGPVDQRAGTPSLRFLRDAAPAKGESKFTPIAMSSKEMQLSVADLPHITFLAGADALTPVPEVFIPSSPTRRGALSYVVARAFEGKASASGSDSTLRRQLFGYVRQQVQHYSDDQRIENIPSPATEDQSVLNRPVFRLVEPKAASPVQLSTGTGEVGSIKLAVVGTDPNLAADLGKPAVPYQIVADRNQSDLVWDPATRQVVQSSGDIVESDVPLGELAGIIDRTAAIAAVKVLTDPRPQEITMLRGVKRYTPSDPPVIQASHMAGRYLLVLNIAANGVVQKVYPGPDDPPQIDRDAWSYNPTVTPPFGADYLVAVASSAPLGGFEKWLDDPGSRRAGAAALLKQQLTQALAVDPKLRLGAVALYTAEK